MKKISIGISIIAAFLLGATAQAALVITIEEVGNDVVATASGTLNMADLTATGGNITLNSGYMSPSFGCVFTGSGTCNYYTGATGGALLGTGGFLEGNSATGNAFGLIYDAGYIAVSDSYISGAQIDGTATWNNQTFATLGIDETSFTMTWGSGDTADSMTVNAAVPEPATASMMALVAGLGFLIRRHFAA